MTLVTQMIRTSAVAFIGCIGAFSVMASDVPNMSCRFDTFIGVSHMRPTDTKKHQITQSMKIVNGKTDDSTLNLDGSKRATNSKQWTRLELSGWDTWESSYVGNFREVLSLAHDLGANNKRLHGLYKASLASPGVESTKISVGECRVE